MAAPRRKSYGFKQASQLMQPRIKAASEKRGFAVTRLLTHWAEIVGERAASQSRPVKISYGQGGFGATLTVLTTGAQAPMLQADLPNLKEKVNRCYGYNAISRIRITQTAPTGFSEGRVAFEDAPKAEATLSPEFQNEAQETARDVSNPDLRAALAALGTNIIAKSRTNKG